MDMKVYLAGPMRGIPNFNFPAFDYATEKLRDRGFVVFSPAARDRKLHGDKLEQNPTGREDEAARNIGFSLREALKADCAWICRNADAVAVLPGWEISRGANAEVALAKALGLTIIILGKEFVK